MAEESEFVNLPEYYFINNVADLPIQVQQMYDDSRKYAQTGKWEEHIKITCSLIPCLHYLGMKDWISRILGRMAWSYIRLNQENHATNLLKYSESYDTYQSLANYYWASEYSHRTGKNNYAKKCLERFRAILKKESVIENTEKLSNLELAVKFYKLLIEFEQEKGNFQEKNNQSDIGRYFELKARLEQNPAFFNKAAKHYKWAGLDPYAACCEAFAFMSSASHDEKISERLIKYSNAHYILENTEIFADVDIKNILIVFLKIRIRVCEIIVDSVSSDNKSDFESSMKIKINSLLDLFLNRISENEGELFTIAARITSLSMSDAWEKLEDYISNFKAFSFAKDLDRMNELDRILEAVQKYLPSYTFLTTP